jgi:hypothetical protein
MPLMPMMMSSQKKCMNDFVLAAVLPRLARYMMPRKLGWQLLQHVAAQP